MMKKILLQFLLAILPLCVAVPSQAEQLKKTTQLYVDSFEFSTGVVLVGSFGYFQVIEIPIPPNAWGQDISVEVAVSSEGLHCITCFQNPDVEFYSVFNFFSPGTIIQHHGAGRTTEGGLESPTHASAHQTANLSVGTKNTIYATHFGQPGQYQGFRTFLNWTQVVPTDARYLQLLVGVNDILDGNPNLGNVPSLALTSVLIKY